jgi:hypothetical protein
MNARSPLLASLALALVMAGCTTPSNESNNSTATTTPTPSPTPFNDTLVAVSGVANYTNPYDAQKVGDALRQMGFTIASSDAFGIEAKRNDTGLSIHVPGDHANWTLLVSYNVTPARSFHTRGDEAAGVASAWSEHEPEFRALVEEFDAASGWRHAAIEPRPVFVST